MEEAWEPRRPRAAAVTAMGLFKPPPKGGTASSSPLLSPKHFWNEMTFEPIGFVLPARSMFRVNLHCRSD